VLADDVFKDWEWTGASGGSPLSEAVSTVALGFLSVGEPRHEA
jgi:hypothetical protein